MELSDHRDIEIRNNVVQILRIVEIYFEEWKAKPDTAIYRKLRRVRSSLYSIRDWKIGYEFSTRVMEVLVKNKISYSSRINLLRKLKNREKTLGHLQLRMKCKAEFRQLFDNLKETIDHPKSNEICRVLRLYLLVLLLLIMLFP